LYDQANWTLGWRRENARCASRKRFRIARSLKTKSGDPRPGREVVDCLWEEILLWATQEQPRLQAEQQRQLYRKRILEHPEGERVLTEFNALE
jgi:hypothetical protein